VVSFSRALGGLVVYFILGAAAGGCSDPDDPTPAAPDACDFRTSEDDLVKNAAIDTPRWAFEPWISKDISSGEDTYAFVKGFQDRDIPVGAVVIDSPWETNYNTFIPRPSRYPNFDTMVADLHADSIRVIVWITPFVNTTSFDLEMGGGDLYENPSPNHEEAAECGFFVNDAEGFGWWKGIGSAIDFMNPRAVAWWRRQQDPLLAMGIDGYKLDFGEDYITSDPVSTAAGPVPHQAYSEAYYDEFYSYGVHRRGPEFVTMVRAYDKSYEFEGRFYARPEDAPVAWMGDNRRDYVGLVDSLDHMFRSAAAGYAMVGSDIGGYLDRDDESLVSPEIPFDPVVFARWTAVGALSPFMQLHGRANITPWTVEQQNDAIVNLYRYWSKLHSELVPFFYSLAREAYAGGPMIVRPEGDEAAWPGDYRYRLGEALLVAPILDAAGKRDIELPAGARWFDWWQPDSDALEGGQTLAGYDASDIAKIPLFVRAGAILPLAVGDAVTGLGTSAAKGELTVLAYPDAATSSFRLHEEGGGVITIELSAPAGKVALVSLTGEGAAIPASQLRIRADLPPVSVSVDGAPAAEQMSRAEFDAATEGYWVEAGTRSVWVKFPGGPAPRSIEVL
jgi:alpha-D-xyloside xylohydrolase